MKYKLIKEYPDSPKLGTEISSENKLTEWRGTQFYESNPEYWEKVNENLWWCVWEKDYIQYDVVLFNAWTPYEIECIKGNDCNRHYFETKEEAEDFILYRKPCLSMHDILRRFGYSREFGKNSIVFTGSEETLTEFINDTK